MELKLDDASMKALVSEAILRGIDEKARETLIREAITGLLEKKGTGRVLQVPPAYSSQTCAECGVIDKNSRQSQSRFVCTACGHVAHADVNAAKILLGRGLHAMAVEATASACGGALMAGPKKQERRSAKTVTRLRTVGRMVKAAKTRAVINSG